MGRWSSVPRRLRCEQVASLGESLLPVVGRAEPKRQADEEQANPSSTRCHRRDGWPPSVVGGEIRVDEQRVDALDLVQRGIGERLMQVSAVGVSGALFELGPASVDKQLHVSLVLGVHPDEPTEEIAKEIQRAREALTPSKPG